MALTKPTFDVRIDWDCIDWAAVPDFSDPPEARTYDDISGYVSATQPFRIARNKKPDDWVYPAATLELTLNNESRIFYPTNEDSPLCGKIRPWLPIRIIATHLDIPYPLYFGFINRLVYYPKKDAKNVYFYATDGIDVLAKAIIIQDMDDKTIMSDGAAVDLIATKGGWSTDRRIIDTTGGDIINQPDIFTYVKDE